MKKTVFKFKDAIYSDGTYISDGHFAAEIVQTDITWKYPTDEVIAAVVKREKFTYNFKNFEAGNCPDLAAMVAGCKESKHQFIDTNLINDWRGRDQSLAVRLFYNPALGFAGIDQKYWFLTEGAQLFAMDIHSAFHVPERNAVIMPIYKPVDGIALPPPFLGR